MLMSNGKRFIAYELVKELHVQGQFEVLDKMKSMVNTTDKLRNKKHEVFEPSFNCKPCYSKAFTYQKVEYIHYNPCKTNSPLALHPADYEHSSAQWYFNHEQGIYPIDCISTIY